MASKVFSITEYGKIYKLSESGGNPNSLEALYLDDTAAQGDYWTLYNYIDKQLSSEEVQDQVFKISRRKGKDVITAQSKVGVLLFGKDRQIEILPKIAKTTAAFSVDDLRSVFLNMLTHVRDFPLLSPGMAALTTRRDFPIIEVFIDSYITELEKVLLTGVKYDYESVEENIGTLRGKLMIPQHVRNNVVDITKFYCRYQKYSINNAVNRVIRTTLELLLLKSQRYSNRDRIYKILDSFKDVSLSSSIDADLAQAEAADRTYRDYVTIINWSKIFLSGSSFTNYTGSNKNMSILLPMEKVFESHVSYLFKKYSQNFYVKTQDKSVFLAEKDGTRRFGLKPDIVVYANGVPVLIADTKWKNIDSGSDRTNYGISQMDMYQMYSYGKRYGTEFGNTPKLALIYPENDKFAAPFKFGYDSSMDLNIIPFSFDRALEEPQISNILRLI